MPRKAAYRIVHAEIAAARALCDMSQEQLAKAMHWSSTYCCNVERGLEPVDRLELQELGRVLSVDTDCLTGRSSIAFIPSDAPIDGRKLKRLRMKEPGVTREKLGGLLGYGKAYIAAIEQGAIRSVPWDIMQKLADCFLVSRDELMPDPPAEPQPEPDPPADPQPEPVPEPQPRIDPQPEPHPQPASTADGQPHSNGMDDENAIAYLEDAMRRGGGMVYPVRDSRGFAMIAHGQKFPHGRTIAIAVRHYARAVRDHPITDAARIDALEYLWENRLCTRLTIDFAEQQIIEDTRNMRPRIQRPSDIRAFLDSMVRGFRAIVPGATTDPE